MDVRRLLNVGYAHLTDGMTVEGRKDLDRKLGEKFPHEMTERERARAEMLNSGAEPARKQLLDAFNLPGAVG